MHYHKCDRCGHIWGHGEEMRGNDKAHECSECGEPYNNWRYKPTSEERKRLKESAKKSAKK